MTRIDDVESIVLKIPGELYLGSPAGGLPAGSDYFVRPPWRSLYARRYETLLVRLRAEDGTTGWGEALAPVGPEVAGTIVDRLLAPTLRGLDATRPRVAWHLLRDLMRERGHLVGHQADALAAVDIALWDLAGRLAGRSVADLLGGAFRAEVETYVSGLAGSDDDERAALVRQWADRGATAVKLHLGHGVAADLATVDAVRASAPSVRVAVDAHWVYPAADAVRLARGLADRAAWFLEAPLAPEDAASHAELRAAATGVPIAVGETLRNRYEFADWLDRGSLDLAQPDVGRTGITEAVAIAGLCSARHRTVAPHHSVGLGVALAAGVQLSAALENFAVFEYQPAAVDVGMRILKEPLPVSPDRIDVPTGPGLGIEVDVDAVRTLAKES
jgi:D-galactarolactone cycloisomerase